MSLSRAVSVLSRKSIRLSRTSSSSIMTASALTRSDICEGWLWKKPLKSSRKTLLYQKLKSWKRRWFVLKKTCIYYFRDDQSSIPLGRISLDDVHVSIDEDDEGSALGAETQQSNSKRHQFYIHTHFDTHLLAASSVEERQRWVDSIVGVCGAFQFNKQIEYLTKLVVCVQEAKIADQFVGDIERLSVYLKIKTNFQEFQTVQKYKTKTPIWNESFTLNLPRFPCEVYVFLYCIEQQDKTISAEQPRSSRDQYQPRSLTRVLSRKDLKSGHFGEMGIRKEPHSSGAQVIGMLRMTILEPEVQIAQVGRKEDYDDEDSPSQRKAPSYSATVEEGFELEQSGWFRVSRQRESADRKKRLMIIDDGDPAMEDGGGGGRVQESEQVGSVFLQLRYEFEDLEGYPISLDTYLHNQHVQEEQRQQQHDEGDIFDPVSPTFPGASNLGSFPQQQDGKQMAIAEEIESKRKQARRKMLTRRYEQEFDRIVREREEDLRRHAEKQSMGNGAHSGELVENIIFEKHIVREKLIREEKMRQQLILQKLQNEQLQKQKELEDRIQRQRLQEETEHIRQIIHFKKDRQEKMAMLEEHVKRREEEQMREMEQKLRMAEETLMAEIADRLRQQEEQRLNELEKKMKAEEEAKLHALKQEIDILESDLHSKKEYMEIVELKKKQMEQELEKEEVERLQRLQQQVRQEEVQMLKELHKKIQAEEKERLQRLEEELHEMEKQKRLEMQDRMAQEGQKLRKLYVVEQQEDLNETVLLPLPPPPPPPPPPSFTERNHAKEHASKLPKQAQEQPTTSLEEELQNQLRKLRKVDHGQSGSSRKQKIFSSGNRRILQIMKKRRMATMGEYSSDDDDDEEDTNAVLQLIAERISQLEHGTNETSSDEDDDDGGW